MEEVKERLSVRSCSIVIPWKRWERNVETISSNVGPSLKRHQHENLHRETDSAARTACVQQVRGILLFSAWPPGKESTKCYQCFFGW